MLRILTFLFFAALISACDDAPTKTETKAETPSVTQEKVYLPSVTAEELKVLWDNCNQVDYLYYELPISSNLDDQYSIQQSLRHVSDAPVPLGVKNSCKPIGRIFYKQDGEDLMEAEIYFSAGCTFFVFFKDGKPASSNLMTDAGVKHYNQIIQKALSLQPQR